MKIRLKHKKSVIADIKAATRKEKQNVKDALRKTAQRIERDAKENVAVDTGRLRSSITHQKVNDYLWKAGTNVRYAPYIEFGTSPHMITPRSKQALAFVSGGQKIVVKKVKHPGTKAQPFLLPAAEKNRARLIAEIKEGGA
jgi:HK97 gp10 family phage protein